MCNFWFDSGLSQMLDMTPLLMPFTLPSPACLEGNNISHVYTDYCTRTCVYTCTCLQLHLHTRTAPNEFLLAQLCPEKNIPSLKLEKSCALSSFSHRFLNKVHVAMFLPNFMYWDTVHGYICIIGFEL